MDLGQGDDGEAGVVAMEPGQGAGAGPALQQSEGEAGARAQHGPQGGAAIGQQQAEQQGEAGQRRVEEDRLAQAAQHGQQQLQAGQLGRGGRWCWRRRWQTQRGGQGQ